MFLAEFIGILKAKIKAWYLALFLSICTGKG